MDIDSFDDLDDLLKTKGKPGQIGPAPGQGQTSSGLVPAAIDALTVLHDLQTQASYKLKDILDASALRGVPDHLQADLVAIAPDLMIYDLPRHDKAKDKPLQPLALMPEQFLFLFLLDNGFLLNHACKVLSIPKSRPAVWKKQSTDFADAYQLILSSLADDAELLTAQIVTTDPKASIERMFFIKAHKTEYRDNAPPPPAAAVQINITLDGKEIDQRIGMRSAGSDDDQDQPPAVYPVDQDQDD